MTSFAARLAGEVRDEQCGDCGGAVVPTHAWLSMLEPERQFWIARQTAERARAERLQPGDPVPPPLICRCADTLAQAIDYLRDQS